MSHTKNAVFLLLLVALLEDTNGFIGGRRRRRWVPPIRIPPVRIPPIRIPPVRIPPIRIPPIRIPPVRIPPIRIPPVRIPPIRVIVRTIGTGIETGVRTIGTGLEKGFNILTKGCCGLHPSYCSNRKEFENRQKQIKARSAIMDKDWLAVKTKLAQIKLVNNNNQIIFRNVRRVTLASKLTVETLDPNVIAKMNNVANELKKALRAKNNTVAQYGINEIGKELEKSEEGAKTELLDATGIGGFGRNEGMIKMTADMFKLVKLDGVANFLTKDVLGFMNKAKLQISKLFGFDKLEELAKNNKALKIVFGVMKFYTDYLSVFGNIFKVMELFGKFTAWITDLATCTKRKDEMATAIKDLRLQHVKINAAYDKLQTTKSTVSGNWNRVFGEAKKEALLTNLLEIENIAKHSSTNSAIMKQSINTISNYRSNIAKSTPAGVIKLQDALIYAVGNVTFNADCYQRKMATYRSVAENCRLGKGSFDELYEKALKDFKTNNEECKTQSGLPYTTKADVTKYVKTKATKLNFETNCLLNSGIKRAVVCNRIHQGYTLAEAFSAANVDSSIGIQYEQSCPVIRLSPLDKKSICLMKPYKTIAQITSAFSTVEVSMVSSAIAQCA